MTVRSGLQPLPTSEGPSGTVVTKDGCQEMTLLRGMVVSADDSLGWTVGMDFEWVSSEMKSRGIQAAWKRGM